MTEPTCDTIAADLPEYALGLLPTGDEARIGVHLETCAHCRHDAESLGRLGDGLLDLVPDAEAPLGLDHRILAGLPSPVRSRRKVVLIASSVLAAAAAIVVAVLVAGSGTQPGGPADVVAVDSPLVANGHPVGRVDVGGRPEMVTMQVQGLDAGGPVSCLLVTRSGTTLEVGTFGLYNGGGSWSVPSDARVADLAGARLVGAGGVVLASATFSR